MVHGKPRGNSTISHCRVRKKLLYKGPVQSECCVWACSFVFIVSMHINLFKNLNFLCLIFYNVYVKVKYYKMLCYVNKIPPLSCECRICWPLCIYYRVYLCYPQFDKDIREWLLGGYTQRSWTADEHTQETETSNGYHCVRSESDS